MKNLNSSESRFRPKILAALEETETVKKLTVKKL